MAIKRNLSPNVDRAADRTGLDEERVVVNRRRFNAMLSLLRIGCGLTALTFGILKFVAPAVFAFLYSAAPVGGLVPYGAWLAMMPIVGIVEIVVGSMLALGLATRVASWIFAAWCVLIPLVTVGGALTMANTGLPTITNNIMPSLLAASIFFLGLPAALLLASSHAGRILGFDRIGERREEKRIKPRVTLYPEEKQKVKY